MPRHFNTADPCNPADHYMLPATDRLPDIVQLIDSKAYFILHAPRQMGKTTTMLTLGARTDGQRTVRCRPCIIGGRRALPPRSRRGRTRLLGRLATRGRRALAG